MYIQSIQKNVKIIEINRKKSILKKRGRVKNVLSPVQCTYDENVYILVTKQYHEFSNYQK